MKKTHPTTYDVIVIGGGASGLMAAGTAAANGNRVLILEKNEKVAKKLAITGGGRCNITNATFDARTFLNTFGKNAKFLFSPLSQFGVQSTFDFFEERGLPLVIEALDRAFPHTQKATDVCVVMEKYASGPEVTTLTNQAIVKINKDDNTNSITSVESSSTIYTAEKYILASGGASHPETGATGDAFLWLRELGHDAQEPTPDIVPLEVQNPWVTKLSGTTLSDAKITFYSQIGDKTKKAFSKTGRILFTHFGISGPMILNSAHDVKGLLYNGLVTATIDAFPNTDESDLEKLILDTFENNKNKIFKNIIKECVPEGFTKAFIILIENNVRAKNLIDLEQKIHSVSKDTRKYFIHLLKNMPLQIKGLMGLDRAVVTDGGVPLTEIDMKTMRSRIIKNLYMTGDILHINRNTGGYSLQLCWTTGWVAGQLK